MKVTEYQLIRVDDAAWPRVDFEVAFQKESQLFQRLLMPHDKLGAANLQDLAFEIESRGFLLREFEKMIRDSVKCLFDCR
jgi:hypothetical protein